MSQLVIEIIGIFSTLLILFSMIFKTSSIKSGIRMRSLNLIGSACFVAYGCLLPAISTAIMNGVLVVVNTYHLILLVKELKKEKKQTASENEKTI